jgi:hypothetical protein
MPPKRKALPVQDPTSGETKYVIPRKQVLTPPSQPSPLVTVMERKLVVVNVSGSSLFAIRYEGGGQPPSALRGSYTSHVAAEKDIERFLIASHRVQSDG